MADPVQPSTPSRLANAWSWIFLGCILIFFGAIRLRLSGIPLERDEGEFAYGGQLFLQGIWPGQGLYTMKLPGTHAAYAVFMSLFGQTATGVHIGFTIINALTILLLFLLARATLGNIAACVAAATVGWLSLSPDVLGTSAHATHFVVLFTIGGLLQLRHAQQTGHLGRYLVGGFLLSCSVLMKHPGAAFVAFGFLGVACAAFSRKSRRNLSTWTPTIFVAMGATLPIAVLGLILWRAGTLENYWFWAVTYARAYAKSNPDVVLVWLSLTQRMPVCLQLPFYAALVGLVALWLTPRRKTIATLATGFLIFSLLAIIPGFHFRPHYYVVLIPALALLIGALVQRTCDVFAARTKLLGAIPIVVFTGFVARDVVNERNFLFRMTPIQACRSLYGFQPFPEAMALADYIKTHSTPDARIAVLGSEPEICFYAGRRSATGYIYTYPLAENQPYARQMRAQMREEIHATRPQFVVQARSWTSWLSRPGPQARIDALCEELMPNGYQLIAVCQFLPEESRTIWHWERENLPSPQDASSQLLLFERTDYRR